MDKALLRKELLDKRLAIAPEDWRTRSDRLCQELVRWLKTQSFTKIALFRSYRQEPDLRPLETLWDITQLFYPKTIDTKGQMEFFAHPGSKGFTLGRWGLEEPEATESPLLPDSETIIVVPGVAYDPEGYRLGYGGGYYDRYFHRHPCSRIGICFHEFLLPRLPQDAHDQRVSYVLTDKGIC